MTLALTFDLTLKSSTKVKYWKHQLKKTSQNILVYYARGLSIVGEVKGQG